MNTSVEAASDKDYGTQYDDIRARSVIDGEGFTRR
jgi:hypothetical protein